jgi:hypothetical protein
VHDGNLRVDLDKMEQLAQKAASKHDDGPNRAACAACIAPYELAPLVPPLLKETRQLRARLDVSGAEIWARVDDLEAEVERLKAQLAARVDAHDKDGLEIVRLRAIVEAPIVSFASPSVVRRALLPVPYPTCIYLRDGSKIVVRRSPESKGASWLEHLSQDTLVVAEPVDDDVAGEDEYARGEQWVYREGVGLVPADQKIPGDFDVGGPRKKGSGS